MAAEGKQQLRSFVEVPRDLHFPIQNLPFRVIWRRGSPESWPRPAMAIRDFALDLAHLNLYAKCSPEQLHARSLKLPFYSNPHILTSLLNLYAKCGLLHHAQRVFDEMLHPNTVSWTALVTAYMDAGRIQEAVIVARDAFANGMCPDNFTAIRVLTTCAQETLNMFLGMGRPAWKEACATLQRIL